MILSCPVCGADLKEVSKTFKCCNGHSYDISKSNYVNLLMSNAPKQKRHGDDKLMVSARTSFLDKGYYDFFRDAIIDAVCAVIAPSSKIVDAGCGDGFYTNAVQTVLSADMLGIDISKQALISAARRNRKIAFAAASISRIPIQSKACHCILNIFSPCDASEFSRILSDDGYLIRGLPTERHLWGLKKAVYDKPYLNPPAETDLDGFEVISRNDIDKNIILKSPEDIHNLFMMTPYYYKTGQRDQKKLDALSTLETELGFTVVTYKKKCKC